MRIWCERSACSVSLAVNQVSAKLKSSLLRFVMPHKKPGKLRLSIFGRHAELRETELRGLPVELSVRGVVEFAKLVQKLFLCDVLFVRGLISSRRRSGIAGTGCDLPVIAYPRSETASPTTDAVLVLVSPNPLDDLTVPWFASYPTLRFARISQLVLVPPTRPILPGPPLTTPAACGAGKQIHLCSSGCDINSHPVLLE